NLTHADLTHADLTDAKLTRAVGISNSATDMIALPDDAVAAVRIEVEVGPGAAPEYLADLVLACSELCRLATTVVADTSP
ncbi:hypothetical protein G3I15_24305, partial [Streptomyces sp. SID10244]|nr:hypothetical protein [Streptomyces sp. SID10244]